MHSVDEIWDCIQSNFNHASFHSTLPRSLSFFPSLLPVSCQGVRCYTGINCDGSQVLAADFRECCTGPGLSYISYLRCSACVGNEGFLIYNVRDIGNTQTQCSICQSVVLIYHNRSKLKTRNAIFVPPDFSHCSFPQVRWFFKEAKEEDCCLNACMHVTFA